MGIDATSGQAAFWLARLCLATQPRQENERRMDTSRARELFQKYGAAVAYVEVESTTGERGLGSAFHVGEGVFVTARHVVDGR